jgi:hypothetical protein
MGHVGIVAGILDDSGGRGGFVQPGQSQREARPFPRGKVTSTGSGNSPVMSAKNAAFAAAAAQVPVVQPRRSGRSWRSMRLPLIPRVAVVTTGT